MNVNDLDMTPRYAPKTALVVHDGGVHYLPVQQYIIHPSGNHPANCPLVPDCTALELRTAAGSRWFGCHRAYINSELRMVVVGTNPRDEVRMKWEVCKVAESPRRSNSLGLVTLSNI